MDIINKKEVFPTEERYILLLRGINISGKNKLAMQDLSALLRDLGFTGVKTLLNSGNAAFNAEPAAPETLADIIRTSLAGRHGSDVPVLVLPQTALKELLALAPGWWDTEDRQWYDNLIFTLPPTAPADAAALLGDPSAELERALVTEGGIFWSFDRAKYQKAAWWKRSAAPGTGERLTIRTAGTVKKLAVL